MSIQVQGNTVIWLGSSKRAELTCRDNRWALVYNPDMGFCSSVTAIGYANVVEILVNLLGKIDAEAMLLSARLNEKKRVS